MIGEEDDDKDDILDDWTDFRTELTFSRIRDPKLFLVGELLLLPLPLPSSWKVVVVEFNAAVLLLLADDVESEDGLDLW